MRKLCIAAGTVLMLTASGLLAPVIRAAEIYDWSGEFVALDEGAKSVTVKARLLDETAAADLKKLKAGDRVLLVWSGMTFSEAIRRVLPQTAQSTAAGELLSSVELVSADTASRYVTFRARIPADGVAALKPLKAGEWVTARSTRGSRDDAAIVSIKPFAVQSVVTQAEGGRKPDLDAFAQALPAR